MVAAVPSRIVTYVHRPKRLPRKRKAAALKVPLIVTAPNRPTPAPVDDQPEPAAKSVIVTRVSRKRWTLRRTEERAAEPDDPEADAAMRAWLERAKWGHEPSQ